MTNFKIPGDFKYSISNIGLSNNRILDITFSDKYDNKEISLHFDLKDISNPLDIEKKSLEKTIQDITIEELDNIENIICSNIVEFCDNKKDIKFVKRSKYNSDYICEDLNCNKNIVTIVKEAVSLFENLGPKEKEYFNKNVRHLLKVRFI
jgi:hypothetical protein